MRKGRAAASSKFNSLAGEISVTGPAPSLANEAKSTGDLSRLVFNTEYRSLKEDPAGAFYSRCLHSATTYKRAVGYFRSSVYLVVGPSVVAFAQNGGRIRLICSPELSPEDLDGIASGYAKRSEILRLRLVADIDRMLAEEGTSNSTRVLASLVAASVLDVRLAVRADRKGLYHEKIGVFGDARGNKVSFKGSANETWNGWHADGNFESIEVFCSWRGGLEQERVRRHEEHFDSLWSGRDAAIDVFEFPEGALNHLKKAALKGGLDAVDVQDNPPPSGRRSPLAHQSNAISGWVANGYRGIFEHATGSGKTYTAILAIRDHVDEGKPAIVLVPSKLLLDQWADEVRAEIPRAALLLAGAGHTGWKSGGRLSAMTADGKNLGGRLVLATMQTASSEAFRSQVSGGDHLLVVVDEVHQIGSPSNARFFEIEAGRRLGLSATPQRYGDPDGTQAIFDYFGNVIPPTITLQDAIKAGRLVEYEYYPHAINLTAAEADEWAEISRRIRTEVARQPEDGVGKKVLTEKVKLLLIRRSRIAKKAAKKLDLAREIVRSEFATGQHWLLYCEDADQLCGVMSALKADGFDPIEYHSSMTSDRDATMAWFRTFGGPLVSIRCLDEGVDIPAVSHALILASSQNPRQFIQRRGRVLRKSSEKMFAVIHDAIVVPITLYDDPDQAALLRSELARSIEFADHAINKMAGAELRRIAAEVGIAAGDLADYGLEEDNDDEE